MSELRTRLKATTVALQTREKSVTELREAVRGLEHDRGSAQAMCREQSIKLEGQVNELGSYLLSLNLDRFCCCNYRATMGSSLETTNSCQKREGLGMRVREKKKRSLWNSNGDSKRTYCKPWLEK